MGTGLYRHLQPEQRVLVDTLFSMIRQSGVPHYKDTDPDVLRHRCERFVREFVKSIEGDPENLARYVRAITRQRIAEGYRLEELQYVLHLLEMQAWRLCSLLAVDRDDLLDELREATNIVNRAKDELARAYVEGAREPAGEPQPAG